MNFKELLKIAINASIQGGDAILDVYSSNFEVKQKEDDSPLTLADQNCNLVIEKYLSNTNIPILSEEGSKIPFSKRRNWEFFWLVDPLDGTKEFVKEMGNLLLILL